MSEIVCNNCGCVGHIYKDCRKPVLSYGHLLYDIDQGFPRILMIQRKDSLCYIEFLRGKYDTYNLPYIQTLIDKFSNAEKQSLTQDFDVLWKNLWRLPELDPETMKYKHDYQRGKQKYENLKEGFLYTKTGEFITFAYFLEKSETAYETSEWEFPKGRRNHRETDEECAKREFWEETGYEDADYALIKNVRPFTEEYMGENRVRYKHVYYLGYLENRDKVPLVGKEQVSEIRDICWLTKEECLSKLRDYHHTRYQVVHKIFDFIEGLGHDYSVRGA